MKRVGRALVVGIAALTMTAGAAVAQNGPPAPPMGYPAEGHTFDWAGPYVGTRSILYFRDAFDDGDLEFGKQIVFGYNSVHNSAVFGFSIYGGPFFDTDPFEFDQWTLGADVRFGVLVSERLLLYSQVGFWDLLPIDDLGDLEFQAGVGAEVAVGRAASIYLATTIGWALDDPEELDIQAIFGINWLPGR